MTAVLTECAEIDVQLLVLFVFGNVRFRRLSRFRNYYQVALHFNVLRFTMQDLGKYQTEKGYKRIRYLQLIKV